MRTTLMITAMLAASLAPAAATASTACPDNDADGFLEVAAGPANWDHALTGQAYTTIQDCLDQAATQGASGVDLVTPDTEATYFVGSTLSVPPGIELTRRAAAAWDAGGANVWASSSFALDGDQDALVRVADNSTLRNIEFNGDFRVENIVDATNAGGVRIDRSALHRTRNDDTATGHLHLLNAPSSQYLRVTDSLFRRAAYEPSTNEGADNATNAAAIYLHNSYDPDVLDSDIAETLSGGIDVTQTTYANIERNVIQHTGKARISTASSDPSADGIVGYHHNLSSSRLYMVIQDNIIRHSYNHGIHVTGRWIELRRNTITDTIWTAKSNGTPIRLDDWRGTGPSERDCTYEVWIEDNDIEPNQNGDYVKFGDRHRDDGTYVPKQVWPSGNRNANSGALLSNSTLIEHNVSATSQHC